MEAVFTVRMYGIITKNICIINVYTNSKIMFKRSQVQDGPKLPRDLQIHNYKKNLTNKKEQKSKNY
jgi:hypothetical protein